jgi:predicted ester cyclase
MSTEENKALWRRFVEELNKGRVLGDLFATDFVLHGSSGEEERGRVKEFFSNVFNAFPDIHFTIDDMIAEGDKVATRWTMTGTHKATNKTVTTWGIGIVRVVGGKIVERWLRSDTLGVHQQLGAIPTPKKEP